MLTETARVVAVDEVSVWVETVRQSVCGSCSVSKGCGHGLLNRLGAGSRNYLQLSAQDFPANTFKVDDQVSIGIPEQFMLRSALIVYLLPLCGMLAGASLAPQLTDAGDWVSIVGATLGLLAGFLLVRAQARYNHYGDSLQLRLLGVVRAA